MAERLLPTPSQTVGPFFEFGLLRPPQPEIVSTDEPGAFLIQGVVLDGQGEPVPLLAYPMAPRSTPSSPLLNTSAEKPCALLFLRPRTLAFTSLFCR